MYLTKFLNMLCVISLKFNVVASQFPSHVDFENVGKIDFNNDKYNVLKLTVHTITDYFQESVLRRTTPKERLFVDKNGFRHSWTGLENKDRKTVFSNVENFLDDSKDLIAKANNANSLPAIDSIVGYINKGTKAEEGIIKSDTAKTDTIADLRKARKQHKKLLRDGSKSTRRPWQQPPLGTTSVTTKYFCPYFGVITMVSFVNNSIVQSWKPTIKTSSTLKTSLTTKPATKTSKTTKPKKT